MGTPFTRDQFFDVFAAYNTALWPLVLALWLAAVLALVALVRGLRGGGRFITIVLAVQWAAAALYHAVFFSRINSGARLFAGVFLVETGLLVWYGAVRERLHWSPARSSWRLLAWAVIAYALLYPVVVLAEGHAFPRMPAFGVPCLTTILTIGFLLAASVILAAYVLASIRPLTGLRA